MLIPCDAEFSWGAYLSREREKEREEEKILRLIVIIILDMKFYRREIEGNGGR